MDNRFLKFKRKLQLEALLKAIALGIGITFLICGITFLSLKLSGIAPKVYLYILLSILPFILFTLISYLILRPNDINTAKRLDSELELGERCKTMVSFKDKEGFMLEIQRNDTLERLDGISKKKLRLRMHYLYFIVLALGLGLGITSFAIPAKAQEQIVDPEFDEDNYILQTLKDLIRFVNESDTEESFKGECIKKLNELLNIARNPKTTNNQMMQSVEYMINSMDLRMKEITSSKIILSYLMNNKDENVKTLAIVMESLDQEKLRNYFLVLNDSLKDKTNPDRVLIFKNLYLAYYDTLKESAAYKKDEFKNSTLVQAAIELGKFSKTNWSLLQNNREIDEIHLEENLNNHKKAISKGMELLSNNLRAWEHVRNSLIELFGIIDSGDVDRPKPPRPTGPNNPDDENESTGNKGGDEGGIGGGDTIYGSDDTFYDPVLNKYVRYGDVIDVYKAQIDKDIKDGVLTEEMIKFYRDYYNKLMEEKKDK